MRAYIALLCLLCTGGNVGLAAEVAKTLEVTGGTVPAATIGSAKVAEDRQSIDGTTSIPKDSTISGRLVGGTLTDGKASAWKADGKNLVDVTLSGAKITGAKLEGVEIRNPGTTSTTPVVGTFQDVELVEVTLTGAKVEGATISAASLVAEKKVTTEAANIPLAGDWFRFNTQVSGIRDVDAARGSSSVGLMAPKGACFRVATEVEEGEGTEKRRYARGTFKSKGGLWLLVPPWDCAKLYSTSAVQETCEKSKGNWNYSTQVCTLSANDAPSCAAQSGAWDSAKQMCSPPGVVAAGTATIDADHTYDIPVEMINERDRYRLGWTYGVLVAPFKYYRDSQTFNAGATVGPYLGYRVFDRQGSATILGFGIGAASAVIKETDANGNQTDSTKTGLSMAVALLIEFKNSFNVGLMIGRDYFSKSEAVPNSGKNWIGVSFGMKIN